jgi:DNA-binding MarR family transcriptional regulator
LRDAKKSQSTVDKRIFHVALAEPSQTSIRLNQQALEEYVNFIRQMLSPEELEQFQSTIEKLIKGFYEKNSH